MLANRITKILNGCAVSEDWRDADGTRGMSLFYYRRAPSPGSFADLSVRRRPR